MAEEFLCFTPEVAAELDAICEAFTEVVRRCLKEEAYFTGGGVTI